MRIELTRETERFGANTIHGVQKIYELDSGSRTDSNGSEEFTIQRLPYETLHHVLKQMAIVVPVKGERIKLVEGVLVGIPNHCLTVLISNSDREPVDRFAMEKKAVEHYARFSKKKIMVIHQKDPNVAKALVDAGYETLIADDGLVRDGKAEGMLIATLMAKLAGKKYVGFVDSDNYFPGAVYEYTQIYAAGFALGTSDHSMVRIVWHSKPKVIDNELYFAKYGRTSVITNRFLNRLVSHYTGFDTEVIRTGNAGEHAISMDLAMKLGYSTGYSIEPQHYLSMMEMFGGVRPGPFPEVMKNEVEIFQIESRNPHLHESKGDEHIERMIEAALSVIYHSFLCPEQLKLEIEEEFARRNVLNQFQGVPHPTYYPPLAGVDLDTFARVIHDESDLDLMTPVKTPRGIARPDSSPGKSNGH